MIEILVGALVVAGVIGVITFLISLGDSKDPVEAAGAGIGTSLGCLFGIVQVVLPIAILVVVILVLGAIGRAVLGN